ncbi:Nramp family divalent metal transporter [Carboxydothermus ferrireducens]|uniref:NRAMP (Natural resistance-associated macrophage protein)-like metal ion transporter n=1 Tax=Carboxydothermus ferrireducens DSM 11255 TaxID=1119529 RepID=A0ABX2R7S4_9THEO|nr:Nramp family divalent metal transporter [Carboxydothermus ferrireducens]NYE57229.1 NRAMP (natural resistance-associated macrophage protein)-like metal ion transporter [Carboxydothermus ferrireducens DSM 11255]
MKKFKVTNKFLQKSLYVLSIIGPGLITVNAGNDAGGIATYAAVGALYGYRMLWGLLLITFSLAVIQEMNARMAVVTGKGLSDLIRENFGVKVTFLAMVILFVANLGVCIGDFAGIAASLELFGVAKFVSVPLMAVFIWYVIIKGSYSRLEKILLLFTVVFFSYIITAFVVKPNWSEVFKATVIPSIIPRKDYILTFIGMIGTTITPYMQFYLQGSIADKGLSLKDYKYEKLDVYFGAFWGDLVSFFIIVTTAATLYKAGIKIETAQDAALALKPLAGQYASLLFGIGLLGASILAAIVIPLSTAYAVTEAFGFERGLDKSFGEAPVFYGIFTFMIFISALLILLPKISLVGIMLATQQLAGILSPIILILMVLLTSKKELMGELVNNRLQSIIVWVTVIFIIILTITLVMASFFNF